MCSTLFFLHHHPALMGSLRIARIERGALRFPHVRPRFFLRKLVRGHSDGFPQSRGHRCYGWVTACLKVARSLIRFARNGWVYCFRHERRHCSTGPVFGNALPAFLPLEFCSLAHSCFSSTVVTSLTGMSEFLGTSNSDRWSAVMGTEQYASCALCSTRFSSPSSSLNGIAENRADRARHLQSATGGSRPA
jgi:hypothetical protein